MNAYYTIKKLVRAIILLPIALVLLAFDVMKIPIVVFFFIPIDLVLSIIAWTRNERDAFKHMAEMIKDISTIGVQITYELWTGKDLF